jgi:hypothetical protein
MRHKCSLARPQARELDAEEANPLISLRSEAAAAAAAAG